MSLNEEYKDLFAQKIESIEKHLPDTMKKDEKEKLITNLLEGMTDILRRITIVLDSAEIGSYSSADIRLPIYKKMFPAYYQLQTTDNNHILSNIDSFGELLGKLLHIDYSKLLSEKNNNEKEKLLGIIDQILNEIIPKIELELDPKDIKSLEESKDIYPPGPLAVGENIDDWRRSTFDDSFEVFNQQIPRAINILKNSLITYKEIQEKLKNEFPGSKQFISYKHELNKIESIFSVSFNNIFSRRFFDPWQYNGNVELQREESIIDIVINRNYKILFDILYKDIIDRDPSYPPKKEYKYDYFDGVTFKDKIDISSFSEKDFENFEKKLESLDKYCLESLLEIMDRQIEIVPPDKQEIYLNKCFSMLKNIPIEKINQLDTANEKNKYLDQYYSITNKCIVKLTGLYKTRVDNLKTNNTQMDTKIVDIMRSSISKFIDAIESFLYNMISLIVDCDCSSKMLKNIKKNLKVLEECVIKIDELDPQYISVPNSEVKPVPVANTGANSISVANAEANPINQAHIEPIKPCNKETSIPFVSSNTNLQNQKSDDSNLTTKNESNPTKNII